MKFAGFKMTAGAIVIVITAMFCFCIAGCDRGKEPNNVAPEQVQGKSTVKEQVACPVMGGEINKNISTTYKGKKVYFCCAGCVDKFNKDPNAYIGKLPQFEK